MRHELGRVDKDCVSEAELAEKFRALTGDFESLTRCFNNLSATVRAMQPKKELGMFRRRRVAASLEEQLDAVYHGDPARSDFDTGLCRGLALGLAAVRGTELPAEILRSLDRLAAKERAGVSPK